MIFTLNQEVTYRIDYPYQVDFFPDNLKQHFILAGFYSKIISLQIINDLFNKILESLLETITKAAM